MEMLKLLIAEGAAVAVQAMADAGLLLLVVDVLVLGWVGGSEISPLKTARASS